MSTSLAAAAPSHASSDARRPAVADPFAEIRHEVGNYLHRLYYLAEELAERGAAARDGAAVRAATALGEAVHGLDDFLALALQLSQPITLELVSMPVAGFVAGVVARIHAVLGSRLSLEATSHAWDDGTVWVDAVRLPAAVDAAAASLVADGPVRLEASPAPAGVEIRLLGAVPPGPDAPADAILRWAVASRIVTLHAGSLAPADDEPAVVLFVPFHS
jgi:hypothetical protein